MVRWTKIPSTIGNQTICCKPKPDKYLQYAHKDIFITNQTTLSRGQRTNNWTIRLTVAHSPRLHSSSPFLLVFGNTQHWHKDFPPYRSKFGEMLPGEGVQRSVEEIKTWFSSVLSFFEIQKDIGFLFLVLTKLWDNNFGWWRVWTTHTFHWIPCWRKLYCTRRNLKYST